MKTETVKLLGDIETPYVLDQKYIDRFWSKVDIKSKDECWEWKAWITKNGYGRFFDGEKTLFAHRFSYFQTHGYSLPPEIFICHKCDNPKCCNPKHLFAGTNQDNVDDRESKGRGTKIKTHCIKGHEYTIGNIYRDKRGFKFCRECRKISSQKNNEKVYGHPKMDKNKNPRKVFTRISNEEYSLIKRMSTDNNLTFSNMLNYLISKSLNDINQKNEQH